MIQEILANRGVVKSATCTYFAMFAFEFEIILADVREL
jgi:hypothetical protein